MIMTFILCSEGDQMLQVFSCQATVEHRAQQQSCGGVVALVSAVFYYIMANGIKSNLTTFLEEKTLCISEYYQFL